MKKATQSTWYMIVMIICAMMAQLGVPAVIAVIMMIIKIRADKKRKKEFIENEQKLADPEFRIFREKRAELEKMELRIKSNQELLDNQAKELNKNALQIEKTSKDLGTQTRKLVKIKELVRSMEYAKQNYPDSGIALTEEQRKDLDELAPSILLKLHYMDSRELSKSFRENDKKISEVEELYATRYSTKGTKAIYRLMVIALRAELQNILYNLKYEKLDTSIEQIQALTKKYLIIAGEGNQSIVNTLIRFVGQIEYLFINAAKIEYNFYVRKEQMRIEQQELREKMKQEAEERKALLEEQKKIENEEKKYHTEIEKLQEKMSDAGNEEMEQLQKRILELQTQLADVIVKKDEVVKLQNGQAGTVYVISNLGSFGEDVFKVGMTRRLEPMDRIKELGNASVPFQFDVHSFIFSDNAVEMEGKMHELLNEKRVNKVNLRKEFFKVSLEELEKLVYQIDPTAEFNRTMLAEEYRQSLSMDYPYLTDENLVIDDEFE